MTIAELEAKVADLNLWVARAEGKPVESMYRKERDDAEAELVEARRRDEARE